MDRSLRRMVVAMGRGTAAALVAALDDSEPEYRRRLPPGRAVALGAVLGTVGRVAARRGGRLVRDEAPDPPSNGTAEEVQLRPERDEAMTRSEEELEVRRVRRPHRRMRLRKYIVTEHVQRTIALRREEIRVEEQASPEEGPSRGAAGAGVGSGEELAPSRGHEIVLYKEVPVIEKRVVPAERVRLVKDSKVDHAEIVDEVRKERIEFEGAPDD